MKGIILAAGKGERLGPATRGIGRRGVAVSKGLIPTHEKPTIYYSLTHLIFAGISDIAIIASPHNVDQYRDALGDGSDLNITLTYLVQHSPRGIADAFIIAEDFMQDDDVALIFCDNIFSERHFNETLRRSTNPVGATIFALEVPNPQDFGVVKFDNTGKALSLEEKPKDPKSNFAIPGVYFYDSSVVEVAKSIEPSARGELEITDVNRVYLERGLLNVVRLNGDTKWFDTGTEQSLSEAAKFVEAFQNHNGQLLGSPEAAAFLTGLIDAAQLAELAAPHAKAKYGITLKRLAEEGSW